MAASSATRARALARSGIGSDLRRRVAEATPAPRLASSPAGFDLIAEIKRRAPSAGTLLARRSGSSRDAVHRALEYHRGGAAMISVLTEPEAFDGSLEDLESVSLAVPIPVLRKDFLVDPLQIFEARSAGAAGVLLIARLLDDALLGEMLDAAAESGCFVLLEAFDRRDLDRSSAAIEGRRGPEVLIGLNCRDLSTLEVDQDRFGSLSDAFPPGRPRVAESGSTDARDVARVAGLGYSLALVGTVLMRAEDPATVVASMIASGRRAVESRCA
jgi:indole-3-glycerol phosphate synthase